VRRCWSRLCGDFRESLNFLLSEHAYTSIAAHEGLRSQGLQKRMYPETKTSLYEAAVFTGDFLMSMGYNPDITLNWKSVVLEIRNETEIM
jgi:hypothetical protein